MNRLPDEVILQIIAHLPVGDNISLQHVSRRCLRLGRDASIWKIACFEASRAESIRRCAQAAEADRNHLIQLQEAIVALSETDQQHPATPPTRVAREQRSRILANWEPGYPNECLDYYNEYIQRHAAVNVGWLDLPNAFATHKGEEREATGVGAIYHSNGLLQQALAPLDDGSVCIWDMPTRTTRFSPRQGKLLMQSRPGLLTGLSPQAKGANHLIMTETGATERVSVDSAAQKAYFGVRNMVHEVDLNTMQLVSSKEYSSSVTALSEARAHRPMVVGTNWTVHLHDSREHTFTSSDSGSSAQLLNGTSRSYVALEQPGPLSILYDESSGTHDSSIWVAGRFTSLLNYDVRRFPRLRGTIHSGARIASLSAIPYPFMARRNSISSNYRLDPSSLSASRSSAGWTMLAAAEYKGKGSLELYGLPNRGEFYKNRQTISSSKLLSVAAHGGRIVVSDGNGNLRWMERNGSDWVRSFNINDAITASRLADFEKTVLPGDGRPPVTVYRHGLWRSSSVTPADASDVQSDIVQKMLPTALINGSNLPETSVGHHTAVRERDSSRDDMNSSNLLLWTSDGQIGVLGFGRRSANPLRASMDLDDTATDDAPESTEQRACEDAERQYGMAMRRALERNADEVRFVRGLGMGF